MFKEFKAIHCCVMFLILMLGGISFNANAETIGEKQVSIGLNKFDLFQQYLGNASGSKGNPRFQRVTQAMAQKAIADASDLGVKYMRVSVAGYAPAAFGQRSDLDLWVQDPNTYWARFDLMLQDLQAANMKIIPNLAWNITQFPAMTGETVTQLMTDPDSKSYQLLSKYVTDFVTRYRQNPQILFYELSNELNLGADLDIVRRCLDNKPNKQLCGPKGNYSTDQMIAFTTRFAKLIRDLDANHPISSGYAVPRISAAHLRKKPEWSQGGADWTKDSPSEYASYLADINQAVDIVSIHLYPQPENNRFGNPDAIGLLELTKATTDKLGKTLFVGEFGDNAAIDNVPNNFAERVLYKIQALKIPYSAPWVWEFYQKSTYITRDNKDSSLSLEPGVASNLLSKINSINRMADKSLQAASADKSPPRVILAWPLDCQVLQGTQSLYAHASDNLKVSKVDLMLDDQLIATDQAFPYEGTLNSSDLPKGEHKLSAKAYDDAGNQATWDSWVLVGKAGNGSKHCANARAGM